MVHWQGVFPALTTKFDANEKLAIDLYTHNLHTQLSAGVDGIILGGTLGESSTLEEFEKEILVTHTVANVPDHFPVILNIAEGSTREAIRQARLAKAWGAKGLMMLPPMRYMTDHRETVNYFKTVADATDLPIMVYNNPIDYKTEVTLDMFEELIVSCSNIQAIKESTRDVSNVTRLKNRFGDRLRILCGVDTLAMEELLMGADGWVAGLVCAFPNETVTIFKLVKQNRINEALFIYRWFLPLLELDIHPKLVQYIKLAETMEGIGSEFVRSPRLTLVGSEREVIKKIIDDAIDCRPLLPKI
ncbi:MAG: dihydrodipicolinate synthase family protein [Saprospiraceae bacterium]|nr:dihydrodipicolinate synthase family protein [Saprospiraceae bacterium]